MCDLLVFFLCFYLFCVLVVVDVCLCIVVFCDGVCEGLKF